MIPCIGSMAAKVPAPCDTAGDAPSARPLPALLERRRSPSRARCRRATIRTPPASTSGAASLTVSGSMSTRNHPHAPCQHSWSGPCISWEATYKSMTYTSPATTLSGARPVSWAGLGSFLSPGLGVSGCCVVVLGDGCLGAVHFESGVLGSDVSGGWREGSVMSAGEERVLRKMRWQYGLVTRAQALTAGMTARQIANRLATGSWTREARGLYRHAATPSTPLSRLLAACIVHDGLASHRSAAALHVIDGFKLDLIELTVSRGRRPLMPGVVLHQSSQMSLAKPVQRQGVPCTRPDRTVLDLAAVVSRRRLDRTIDAVLRDRLLRPSDLYGVLALQARRGRNGCAAFRSALDRRLGDDPVPLSEWSRMVEDLLVDAGLARPRLEYRICRSDGELLAQVDLAYPPAPGGHRARQRPVPPQP